jgi:hypothetical protein
MTDAFFDDRIPASPEDADDALVDALLRGAASDEPARERARVEDVVRSIRSGSVTAPRVATAGRSWRSWAVGSLASLASAAVVVLAVLVIREPEAGAASILDRAVLQARSAGPRSFAVEIEFDVPEGHRTNGQLDLLLRTDDRPLVRLATSDPVGGDRLSGWDVAGPWVQRPDGEVDRPDPRHWTRRFLGGTLDLLVDDLPGFLAGLPLDHDVTIDEAPDGRPRLVATRRPRETAPDRSGPLSGPAATRGGHPDHPPGPPPPVGGGPGPPSQIELVFDPADFELAEVGMTWVREPHATHPPRGQAGRGKDGVMPPPPPRWMRLDRIQPRGLEPGWYAAPEG